MHVQLSRAGAAQGSDGAVEARRRGSRACRGLCLLGIERRIVDLALLAAGADDQVHATALGDRAGDQTAGGEALVVGMGVDQEEAPRGTVTRSPPGAPRTRTARAASCR